MVPAGRGGTRKGGSVSPNLSLEGQSMSLDSTVAGGGLATLATTNQAMSVGQAAGATASGPFSPLRPLSPVGENDTLAQEVEHELKFQGDLAKQNRGRVEAMRQQLRKFQQLTDSNAKEIKALRAERNKLLQSENELVEGSLEEELIAQEDAARAKFAASTFEVPHSDLPDVGTGAKGIADPEAVRKVADSEEQVKDELYPASDPDTDVESLCGRRGMLELAALTAREEAAFMKIKSYKGSLIGPQGEESMQFVRQSHLTPVLERVAGYSVRGRNSNVLWLASRKAVYSSGAIAIVANADVAPTSAEQEFIIEQEFFTYHSEEISAICVHPDGMTVATGEEAAEPGIYVWDSAEQTPLGPALRGDHRRGIAALEFSKDGLLLFSLGRDSSHTIIVYDWKMGAKICEEQADTRRRVLAMRCNPHDGQVVTVGVRHIKFWTLTVAMGSEPLKAAPPISVWKKKLEPRRGVFGRHGVSKSHTLLCVEFGGPGVTITGSRDGSLLVWKGVVLVSWLQAHDGPVFSLHAIPAAGQTKLASGGKDGSVGIWRFDSALNLLYKPIALPQDKDPSRNHKACIRSVCWHETMDEILVGTSVGKILLVSADPDKVGDEPRLVARGHERGPTTALAGHPNGETFVTGAASGLLTLWNSSTGVIIGEVKLPHGITCACYHNTQPKIAVGMEQGGGIIVAQTPQNKLATTSYKFCELVKSDIRIAKYSPECDMLAVCFRFKIEIYNADSIKSKIGNLSGHEGNVIALDWSSDGRYLVTNSDTYELIFWDRLSGSPIFGKMAKFVANFSNPVHEPRWATSSCCLGWAVQGIVRDGGDEFSITTVNKDSKSSILVTGDADGFVSLLPYPCPRACIPVRPPRLHVGPVAQAIFLGDKETGAVLGGRVVTLGSADTNVLIWRLQEAAPCVQDTEEIHVAVQEQDPELKRILQEARATVSLPEEAVLGEVADEFEAAKPYLMSVCPSSIPVVPPESFDWQLQLQHLHGFQGAHGIASTFVSSTGEAVYAAGASCVLQMPESIRTVEASGPQKHFTLHTDNIHCMACRHMQVADQNEGERGAGSGSVTLIASSDGQPNSEILVWDVGSQEVRARLPMGDSNVALLAFANDNFLIAVSNEEAHAVTVWDWKKAQCLAIEDGDNERNNRILSVAVSPGGTSSRMTFVTCGKCPVKFWCFEKMVGRSGFSLTSVRGRVENEIDDVMTSSQGFLDADIVTGSDKGQIYLWREHSVHQKQLAHSGPVLALAQNEKEQQLCSGSNDGCIKIWDRNLRLLHAIRLQEHCEGTFLDTTLRQALPCIRSLDWHCDFDRILLGTTAGEIVDMTVRQQRGEFLVECVEFHAHGHSAGRIRALCSHPSEMLVASGGEDRTIRIWELGEESALFCLLTNTSEITALDFSGNGSLLAVGQSNGAIQILSDVVEKVRKLNVRKPMRCEELFHDVQPFRKRKVPIEVLRFSPDGQYLAAGCTDAFIDVFSADDFQLVGVCKGHIGAISSLDWDADSTHLQSNTWTDELKYWNIPECSENRRSTELRDSRWASFTCRLAWHVLSCVPTGNESSLRSICRQNPAEKVEPGVFAAGFANGEIQLRPFPAPEAELTGVSHKSSCRSVEHVCYSNDSSFLIVAGGPEPVLQVYRHYEIQKIQSDDSDICAIINRFSPGPSRMPMCGHTSEENDPAQMGTVKSYLGALCRPTQEPNILPPSAIPNFSLSLEHVQSFRGHDTRHSLFFTASGALVFMASGLVVVQDLPLVQIKNSAPIEVPRQRHFALHDSTRVHPPPGITPPSELTCICLHPDESIVASAERGQNCVILVWHSADYFDEAKNEFGSCLAKLAGVLHKGKMTADPVGISHLCFGGAGSALLFALGMSEGHPLSMYRWEDGSLLTTVVTNQSKFLALACNPIDHTLVTSGVKHLKFWNVKPSGSMHAEKAVFGERVVARTMCCVDFLVLGAVGVQSGYSRTVTGSVDGCIFLWNREQLLTIVNAAHLGSIFDFAFDKSNSLLFSAGRDGVLRTWHVDEALYFSSDSTLSPRGQTSPLQSATCSRCGYYTSVHVTRESQKCPNCNNQDLEVIQGGVTCIRSLSVQDHKVAVGTSRGEIFLIVPDVFTVSGGTNAPTGAQKEMRLLLPSHGKGAVSALEFHPVHQSIFLTVGDDCMLRMWHIDEKRLLLSIRFAFRSEDGKEIAGVVPTALHVSNDGKIVCVGFDSGHLTLLDCLDDAHGKPALFMRVATVQPPPPAPPVTTPDTADFSILQKGRGGVSSVRFGATGGTPGDDGKHVGGRCMFAAGTSDGNIFVFQDQGGGRFTLAASCKGHSGRILSMDWSRDGLHMQSTSDQYEHLFWRVEDAHSARLRYKLQRPSTCCDVDWPEWTSSLGWWVRGFRNIAKDENSILSTYSPGLYTSSLCVAGDVDGQVTLMTFPCSDESPLLAKARIPSGRVMVVRMSPGDDEGNHGEYVLAGSQDGGGLFVWRIQARGKNDLLAMGKGGAAHDQCWNAVMQRLTQPQIAKEDTGETLTQHSDADDNFLSSVHPYLSAIRPPAGWRQTAEDMKVPDNELKLEYVFGYRGHDSCRNVFKINKNEELLYYVACVCVILNPRIKTQRHFTKHKTDVQCIAVAHDRRTVASVSASLRPRALVWNSKSMKELGRVDSKHSGHLCAMCFSADGKILAMAVQDKQMTTIAFYDWQQQIMMAEHKAQPWTILAFECNPVSGTFVTAGVRHVHFWRLTGHNVQVQIGLVEKNNTMTSIAFLGQQDKENTIVLGNASGQLLLWKEIKDANGNIPPDEIIDAHDGPIFDAKNDENELLTCSKGGSVRIWKLQQKCKLSLEQSLKIAQPEHAPHCEFCGSLAGMKPEDLHKVTCVRSVVRLKVSNAFENVGSFSLVIGTGNNSIYQAFLDQPESILVATEIMPSHAKGKIYGLASHPGKAYFASCGEDKLVKVWDREERCVVCQALFEHEPSALAYSVDGCKLIIGFNNGGIHIHDSSTLAKVGSVDVDNAPRRRVRDLKFSPDGRFLAAASDDSKIYIYNIPLSRTQKDNHGNQPPDIWGLVGHCKGHARSVVRLDWSLDGLRLQSESEDYDTILWDMTSCVKGRFAPGHAQLHVDTVWQTRDCLLTWQSSGLLHPVADFSDLLTAARSKLGDALVVGDCNGRLRLHRFPCPSADSRPRLYHGHSLGVSKVCFSYEDRHLMSSGAKDQAIFVWHHLIIPGPEETDAIIDQMIANRKQNAPAMGSKSVSLEVLDAVPQYLSAMVTPTSWNAAEARQELPASFELNMEYLHGFRGAGRNQCIKKIGEDKILFQAAMVLIILDLNNRSQRFFRKHEHDVTCFAIHPGGEMVASADSGNSGKVFIWNVNSMETVSVVSTLAKSSPCALCFAKAEGGEDGDLLVAMVEGQENSLLSVEWEANKRVAIEKYGQTQVLAMASHPDSAIVVTCGLKHIKFWTLEKGHLYPTSGSFGAGKPQTMLCIAFTDSDGESGVPPMTLTGAQNGCIYMWRAHHLDRIIVAHSSPILDMYMTGEEFLTCGIDGLVRIWSLDWTSCARLDVSELTRGLQGFSAGVFTPVQSVLMLRHDPTEAGINNAQASAVIAGQLSPPPPLRHIVVGLDSNEIYKFTFDGPPDDVEVLPATEILIQGHAPGNLCKVCAHPSAQQFATISHDKTLRIWDCNEFCPIGLAWLPAMGADLSYFPDGKRLAAGLLNGSVVQIELDSKSAKITGTILEKRASPVTCVKFSPSGRMLAIGYENGAVDILDVGAICCYDFSCKATGPIERVDFSTDETVLQVSTATLELTFWDLKERGKQLTRAVQFRDKTWATWTSRFGFPVQALSSTVKDLTCVQKAAGTFLAAGMMNGRFLAYAYPAIGPVTPKSFHAHLAPVADICFTVGDERIITIGLADCSIIQWKVVLPEPREDSQIASDAPLDALRDAAVSTHNIFVFLDHPFEDWETSHESAVIGRVAKIGKIPKEGIRVLELLPGSVILKLQLTCPGMKKVLARLDKDFKEAASLLRKDCKASHLITDEHIFWSLYRPKVNYLSSVPNIEVIEDLSQDPDLLKPYMSTSVQPNMIHDKEKVKAPPKSLDLEYVHGFGGFNRIGNLFYVQTGELLYTVATLAVVHDVTTGFQSFFRKHNDEIVAMSLHKDGQLVATADNGSASIVYIWSSVTMETLGRVTAESTYSVVSLCFSSDSSKLIVVSQAAESRIEVFDWRQKKKPIVVQQIDRSKILAMRSNPYDDANVTTFVTSGVNHIRGWALKDDSLKGHSWTGDSRGKGVLQTIPTVTFPHKNTVIAGTQGGSLYVFKISAGSLMLVKTIDNAHQHGPVYELWSNEAKLLSGGKDGLVNMWRFSVKLGSIDLQYLKSYDIAEHTGRGEQVAIKSITFQENPPALAVGTSTNQVVQFNEVSNQTSCVVAGHSGGHSAKSLNLSLCLHPSDPDLMLSGGANGDLFLWNIRTKKVVDSLKMDSPIFAVEYSCSGHAFAVAVASGHFFVHTGAGIQEKLTSPDKQPRSLIGCLKFAPNDQHLALGLENHKIVVYDVAGKECTLVMTLKGHGAPVTELDWDRASEMTGSPFIRSISSGLELLYWSIPLEQQVIQSDTLEHVAWNTNHCKLGWYTRGILQSVGNEHRIVSMDVMKDLKMIAVSIVDADKGSGYGAPSPGCVKLFQYPCVDAEALPYVAVGHVPPVTKLRFACNSETLITLGGKDQSIMQWQLLETRLDSWVQALVSKAELGRPLYELPGKRQLKTAMIKSAGEPLVFEQPPSNFLELDFVHGYGGHNNNCNLFVLATGELLYNAASLCIVFDPQTRVQQFFCDHHDDIMALALHPDGVHVASGDVGPAPALCLWDVEAMVCVARLDGGGLPGVGGFEGGVVALAFSPQKDAPLLAAVGADKDHTLYLIDWKERCTIAAGKCGSGRVLACTFSAYGEKDLVTCGVMHIKFWKRSGDKMVGRDGVFGKHEKKVTMQCVDVNPANFVQHAGQKGVTLTGGMDGKIFMFGTVMSNNEWRPEVLNKAVVAHHGPVFALCHDNYTLLVASCGADGYIKTWKLKTYLNPKDKSKTEIDLSLHEQIHIADLVTDLPVHVSSDRWEERKGLSPATFGKSILFSKSQAGPVIVVGTNTGEILQFSIDTESKVVKDKTRINKETMAAMPVPASLLIAGQGGDLMDLTTPTDMTRLKNAFTFSVGGDRVLKMWDLSKRCIIAVKGFEAVTESALVSVDYQAEIKRVVVAAQDGTIILLSVEEVAFADQKGKNKEGDQDEEEEAPEYFLELSREKARGTVSKVRLSGNVGNEYFLAVGREDGLIDFFSVKGNLAYIATTRVDSETHEGAIMSLDWSISPAGYLASSCDRGVLCYWGALPSVLRQSSTQEIAGLEMHSWTSRVGWPVKSLAECFDSDIEQLMAVERSKSGSLLVAADISGALSVCHFPCLQAKSETSESMAGRSFTGHSHLPIAVRFFNNDMQIVSAGRSDHCLIQWRHYLQPTAYHPDLQLFVDSARLALADDKHITMGDSAAAIMAPLKWKPSRKMVDQATLAPDFVFQLEHVYGYRGHDMKGNVIFLHRKRASSEFPWSGNILYHIAGVAVIHHVEHNQQRKLVDLGMKSIVCQALSDDAGRVVTGEGGESPSVVVWRVSDGLILNRFRGFHENGVVAVCFCLTEQGSKIMTVSGDKFHKVAIYDLSHTVATSKHHKPIAWRSGGATDILAIGCYQDGTGTDARDVYVSVGKRHIRVWRLIETGDANTQYHLDYTKAFFGEFDSNATFTCLSFAETVTVIGADDGSIYLMKNASIVRVFASAHTGAGNVGVPVLDLDYLPSSSEIVSSGSDGNVKFWSIENDNDKTELIEKEGGYELGEVLRHAKNRNNVISSVHAFSPAPDLQMPLSVKSGKCLFVKGPSSAQDDVLVLMGTGTNEIVLCSRSDKKRRVVMQGHLMGSVNAVAAHPTQLIFGTGGSDCSLQIWDAETRMLLAMGFAENEIKSLDWAPNAQANQPVAAGLVGGNIAVFQYTVGRHSLVVNNVKIEDEDRRDGFETAHYSCLKYSPDGMYIAAGSSCGHVDVFDVLAGAWIGAACASEAAITSVDWSADGSTVQVCSAHLKLSYWDVSRKDSKTFARKSPSVNRDQIWGSWSSPIGWPVTGIHWEHRKLGAIAHVDTLTSVRGSFDFEFVTGQSQVPNLILVSTRDALHLINFPALAEAKLVSQSHPATRAAAARFSRDGSRVFSIGGDGLCILQWRILSPDEVGLTGARTRAKRATEKVFKLIDREQFWKISRKEIDDLKQRGVRSDIIRIVEPQSKELQKARLQVIDFTFDQVDMTFIGREVNGEPMVLPIAGNVAWEEMLLMLQQFVFETDENGVLKSWCFLYEKFKILTKEGWEEVSELRLRTMNPSLREAEMIKLKNESRISYSVKSELDFRQCWHWIEHEYRWILSSTSDVPEGQRFPMSVYLIPYQQKIKKAEQGAAEDLGEGTDAESDVEVLLSARQGVVKKANHRDEATQGMREQSKLEAFVAPSGWDDLSPADVGTLESAPLYKLTAQSMHGYNGRRGRGNLGTLKEGELVYPVGGAVVVHDRSRNKQSAFSGHHDLVSCLAVGHDKETVASATAGDEPEICVWNGYTLVLHQRFRDDHDACIVALSFSKNDPWLASVGGGDGREMKIVIYDYARGSTVLTEDHAGKNRIMSMAFNPHVRIGEVSFVTVSCTRSS